VEAALKEADDERVSGDARSGGVPERASEVLTGVRTERLARAKPEQRVRGEPLTKRAEQPMVAVIGVEDAAVQHVSVDEDLAPLAVAPELELGDGPTRVVAGEESQRSAKVPCAVRAVHPAQRAVQVRSVLPAVPQRTRLASSLSPVVND
jgi:hypothetical protein